MDEEQEKFLHWYSNLEPTTSPNVDEDLAQILVGALYLLKDDYEILDFQRT